MTDDTSSARVAGVFQTTLASEAESFSTTSEPYNDPESTSQYPTIQSQPIILGFSLPPRLFSCTPSTRIVVNVFCQLVAFVRDHKAWGSYATRPTPTSYTHASVRDSSSIFYFLTYLDTKTFRNFERSWTRDDNNRDLLRDLGGSMCADLVKVSLCHSMRTLSDIILGSVGIVSRAPHRLH